jgi:nucleotide-binding universal stress UspA family protein
MFFNKLLVAVDDSEPSRYAIEVGLAVAQRDACPVVFGIMLNPELLAENYGFSSMREIAEQRAREIVDLACARAHEYGVAGSSKVLFDHASDGIITLATAENVGMIVMGTHGRTGLARGMLGSVAEAVLRRSKTPLCIVRRPRTGAIHQRFIVAVADDELAQTTIQYAIDLAGSFESTILFCTVLDVSSKRNATDLLEDARRLATEHGVTSDGAILEPGNISKAILNHAYAEQSDAILMSSHGREGFQRLVQGSVAEAVIRSSLIPVVVVR